MSTTLALAAAAIAVGVASDEAWALATEVSSGEPNDQLALNLVVRRAQAAVGYTAG